MSINIAGVKLIQGGNSSFIVHNADNSVWEFTENNGKFHYAIGSAPLGIWDNVSFTKSDTLIMDDSITNIRGKSITNSLNFVVWKDGNSHRIIAFPDDYKLYDPTSVHRLYWAVDTDKLYMNISDTWQMIGTLNHNLMKGSGKYQHNSIDNILEHICNKLGININDLLND